MMSRTDDDHVNSIGQISEAMAMGDEINENDSRVIWGSQRVWYICKIHQEGGGGGGGGMRGELK